MSLNIQTATGLLEIGGKVTKDKVVEALGYEPANKTHVEDNTVHITSEERENWNNKFDGTYADLEGSPNITEDESGNFVIADGNGNAIMQVDSDGVTTTNVNTKSIALNGEDLGSRLDSLESISLPNILDNETGDLAIADGDGNTIVKVDANGITTTGVSAKTLSLNGEDIGEKIDAHIDDSVSHVTSEERTAWNNKSDFSGDYNDLNNKPNITDDESDELVLNDNNGNVIAKINENGLETTTVTAKSAMINGVDITAKLDEHKDAIDGVGEDLETHTSDTDIHITSDERTLWNNKSDFSGDYNDLENAPDIKEDNSGEVVLADAAGNVIAKIGQSGFETTQVTAKTFITNGVDIGSTLSSHVDNDDIHITATERTNWNAKANQSDLEAHIANKDNPHKVTAPQLGLGNVDNTSDIDKPVSTAQREALNALKSELSESIVSESKEWIVADEDGNVIVKVDANGLETTTVTAKAVVVNGIDVESALAGKASGEHKHSISDVTNLETNLNAKADKTYVDAELAKKAESAHTHEQYLEAEDITGKADTSYVDEQLALKADSEHTHEQYLDASDIEGLATVEYVDGQLETKADSKHSHDEYLVERDIVGKADRTELHEHDNKDILDGISSDKVTSWDNKSDFDGQYNSLIGKPNVLDDNSAEFSISDVNNNVIFRVDTNGVQTTSIHTDTLVLANEDIGIKINNKADRATTLEGYGITDAASKAYVDTLIEGLTTEGTADAALVQAMLNAHTNDKANPHCVTLNQLGVNSTSIELNHLVGATSNIQEQLNNKAASSHTHNYTKIVESSTEPANADFWLKPY